MQNSTGRLARTLRKWRQRLHLVRRGTPMPGRVDLGDLRRLDPVSREFGYDRGLPIDRVYIESFLAENAALVRGRVLEIGDRAYTDRFGGSRVQRSDVLNVHAGNPATTIVADLADGGSIPSDAFDCIVCTQTLQLIYDARAAIRTLQRILAPGGTLLLTVPGTISQVAIDEWGETWYWGFTGLALRRMFAEHFAGAGAVEVRQHGNVLASVAFLNGLAAEELTPEELRHQDELYPLLLTVKATRPR